MKEFLARECKAGCHKATTDPSGYCPQHKEEARQREKAADKERNREQPWHKWYSEATWRRLRKWFLHQPENAICAWVDDRGVRCTCEATECDHIVPHRGDWWKFVDTKNLQGLCKMHHSEKTAREVWHQ